MQNEDYANIESIVAAFFSGIAGVELVFLFGSAAQGRLGVESDIDVAVELQEKPDPFQVNLYKEALGENLRRDVDLVVLNQSSPILRMQVLKYGKLIYCSDRKQYCRFFTRAINEYDDLKRVRRPIEESILKGPIHA